MKLLRKGDLIGRPRVEAFSQRTRRWLRPDTDNLFPALLPAEGREDSTLTHLRLQKNPVPGTPRTGMSEP